VHGGAHGVDDVGILRVDEDAAGVVALAVADAGVLARHVFPVGAAVVGAEESRAVFDVGTNDVHALAVGVHGDGYGDAALEARDFDLGPGLAFVGGLEALRGLGGGPTRAALGWSAAAAFAAGTLCGGQHDIGGVEGGLEVARAVVVGSLESAGPVLAAVGGAVDAAA